MLAGKNLIEYTEDLFSPYDFEKMIVSFWAISKMDNLSNQTKFRLQKINKIEDLFYAETRGREQMNKKVSKYNAAVDYFDKILIVL